MENLSFKSILMFMIFILLLNYSCRKDPDDNNKTGYTIALLSDIHYMDPSLLSFKLFRSSG